MIGYINSNMHSQAGAWEQGRSPVGCDCYRTIYAIFKMRFQFFFMPIFGAIAIAPYGFLLKQKHYNLTSFFFLLFFNVKIHKNLTKGIL